MTVDESIKLYEENAEIYERQIKDEVWVPNSISELNCIKNAEEHRQLAEWLKELKKLREHTRWTPVNEGLPEPWASVLITFSGKYGSLTADHAIGIGSWDDVNGWYFDDIEGYTDSLTVSAWMNLPESYKEE